MSDQPSKAAQLAELERELRMRHGCYKRFVQRQQITQEQANHRIACLTLVIEDFKARHAPGSQQGTLGI